MTWRIWRKYDSTRPSSCATRSSDLAVSSAACTTTAACCTSSNRACERSARKVRSSRVMQVSNRRRELFELVERLGPRHLLLEALGQKGPDARHELHGTI